MLEHPERVEQFKAEIAEMRLPDAAAGRERMALRASAGMMALGVVLVIAAYALGHSTSNPLQQRDAIVASIIGLTVAVVGSALFIRYSMAQFLRFWLARLSWEQAANGDRLVEALRHDK